MGNINYYNNEIGKCFNKIQAELSRPISDECRKKLDLVASDISKMLKEYNNIQDYINKILSSNYFFRSIYDMNCFISSSMKKLNYYDTRITNLQSVLTPIKNLNEKFCKARSYAEIIIKACDDSININSDNNINTSNDNNLNNNYRNINNSDNTNYKYYKEGINNNSNINSSKVNINYNDGSVNSNIQGQNGYNNIPMNNSKARETGQNENAYKIIYILGIIMILIGVSIFGKYVYVNYLNDFIKGILLYVVGASIILLSELLLKKKNMNYSRGVTIMGLCELYIAIMINAMGLHNINEFIAIILVLLLSIITIIYSVTQKSFVFRYFAHGAGLICFLFFVSMISKDFNSSLLVAGYIVILNVLNVVLPIENHNDYLSIFSVYTFVTNSFIIIFMLLVFQSEVYVGVCVFYIVFSLLMDRFIMKKLRDDDSSHIFNDIFLAYVAMLSAFASGSNKLSQIIIFAIGIIVCIICALLCKSKNKCKYLIPGVIFALKIVNNMEISDANIQNVLFYFVLTMGILLLGYIKVISKNIFMNIGMNGSIVFMIVISFINCAKISCDIDSYFHLFEMFLCFISIAGVMICHIVNEQKNVPTFSILKYYSYIFTVPTAIAIGRLASEEFIIMAICAISLILMIIYSNVKYLRNDNYKTDNVLIAFSSIAISLITLFRNTNIVSFVDIIILIICFITFALYTRDKYNNLSLSILSKMVILNIMGLSDLVIIYFKTYDANNNISIIIIDILFMALACIDVIRGFANKCKNVRVLGIVIALITCLKVPLIDCIGMDAIQKTLIFIGVGIISMILAYVYSSYIKRNSNFK